MIKYPHKYWVLTVKGMPDAECNTWDLADSYIRSHNANGRDVRVTEYRIMEAGAKPVKGTTVTRRATK